MKYFLITFPISHLQLMALRVTMNNVGNDHILRGHYDEIDALDVTEYLLINNRYLVVRIR